MSAISKNEAIEKLAQVVEGASSDDLAEIYTELFPEKKASDIACANAVMVASQLARHIRAGLEPEEITDLWNVVFPSHRQVQYDEEEEVIRYNAEESRYAEW